MPFRCRQKMHHYPCGLIYYEVGQPNPDTGVVEFTDVCQQAKLPDVEMTDLKASLKAGVNLQQVKCKLITGDTHALAERLNGLKESDSQSNPAPTEEPKE